MRVLHLVFRLQHPYELREEFDAKEGYFAGAESFRAADQRDYQPFLALLERNAQHYPKLRVSLVVSGMWLEQAEQWCPELVRRLKKLVASKNVEIIVTPYYDSLAAFYDMDDFATQVRCDQEKIAAVLGAESRVLVLPEFLYHNRIARWAEKADFRGILAGDATKVLDWRTCNQVYDAKGCENLKVLFMNAQLTEVITKAKPSVMAQEEVEGAPRTVYSVAKYQKLLDLASLRGNLLNLYFGAELFGERREAGVIKLFDDLIETWMETPGYRLVGASEAISLPAVAEVSVKRTISSVSQAEKDYVLPNALADEKMAEIYALKDQVVASKDRDLYVDFARLTTLGLKKDKSLGAVLADIERRSKNVVAAEGDEVENGLAESHKVDVKIKKNPEKRARQAEFLKKVKDAVGDADDWLNNGDLDDAEAAVQVLAQRISWQAMEKERDVAELAEAEVIGEDGEVIGKATKDKAKENAKESKASKKTSLRERISKKIVIE